MKFQTLPVKRRPVPKGIFKRLSAVTNRKQRVAATADPSMLGDDSSSKISRALTIIFLIHIVAIGLIFVHQKFLDGRMPHEATAKAIPAAPAAVAHRPDLPRVEKGDPVHIVTAGDNYSRIAANAGVDEEDLRSINKQAEIVPGLILKIPPKRIVAKESPEITAIRKQAPVVADSGLVDAMPLDTSNAPKAKLVKPMLKAQPVPTVAASVAAPVVSSGKSYVVQNGDSVWRIANRFKVDQAALMKANGISDAKKIRPGMTLQLPR